MEAPSLMQPSFTSLLNASGGNVAVLTRRFPSCSRPCELPHAHWNLPEEESQYVFVNKLKWMWAFNRLEKAKGGDRLLTSAHYRAASWLQRLIDSPLCPRVLKEERGVMNWHIAGAGLLIQARSRAASLQGPVTLLFRVISSPSVWGPGCQPLPKVTQIPAPFL